jgi:MFS family permease
MSDETKASRSAWYALAVLVAVAIFASLDRQVLTIALEPVRRSFGLSDLQIGMLQGLGLTLAAAVGGIPLAWLADRFDRRVVLALCVLVWSAATAWRGAAQGFNELFAGTVGLALAEAGLGPIVYAMIPSLFHGRQRATANLVFYTASVMGFSLGMVLGGMAFGWLQAQAHLLPASLQGLETWRVVFYAVALPGPVFALLVMTIRTEHSRRVAPSQGQAAIVAVQLGPYLRLHWRTLAGVIGSASACVAAFSPIMAWLAPALTRIFGVPPADVGVQLGGVLGISAVVGIALATVSVRLWGARMGDSLAMHTGQYLAALCVLPAALLAFAGSATVVLVAIALLGILVMAYNALLPGLWQGIAPTHLRARVIAIAGVVAILSSSLAPLAVGWVSDLMPNNPRGLLISIGLICAPLMLLSAVLMRWVRGPLQVTLDSVKAQEAAETAREQATGSGFKTEPHGVMP